MKKILLTQNKYALVDDEDFKWLSQWKWYACKYGSMFYAVRCVRTGKTNLKFLMHREILGLKFGDKKETDHKNHNGLDNQKNNLRIATKGQNAMNNRKRLNTTSKYKGVSWYAYYNKWVVYICSNNIQYNLGYFDNELEAAKIYDTKAKELFGEYANLNFK